MMRVLHELASLDGGGVAKLLFDYYSNIENRDSLKFDFLIYDYYDQGIYEEPLRKMGCRIYKIPSFKKDRLASLREMKQTIKNGGYDVVHSHRCTRGIFALWYAKRYKVARRIIHSHIAYEDVSRKQKLVNTFLGIINRHLATQLFACGKDAARYMWGEKRYNSGNVHIMTNAIDTRRFRFNESIREIKRHELGVMDRVVIGTVGRLNRQKNQSFLLEIYAKVHKQFENTVLLLAGRGADEQMLKKLSSQLGIEEHVMFLGIRDDIPELLNAFDLFVMPSLYEGLPVSVIEAQANGLKVLTSDKVTREVAITDLIEYLPLESDVWIEKTCKSVCAPSQLDRKSYAARVAEAGYDIKIESKRMEAYYLNGAWNER